MEPILRRVFCLSLWLCVLIPLGSAQAATYWLATDGNDANPGTQEAPLKTLRTGVTKLTQDGDELVLKPGQYNGEGIVMVERPGAADYVTIRAEVPGTAKVWGRLTMWGLQVASYTKLQGIWFSGNPSVFSRETQTDLHHIWVEDCQFKSTEESIAATGSRCGWPLSLPWCKYVTVRNCLFQECIKFAALGSKAGPTVYHVQVEKCTFAHNWCESDTNVDGIVIDGPDHAADQDIMIRNCVSWGHGDSGFDIKLKATIENSIAYDNAWSGFKIWGIGSKLINCLAYDNKDCGFALANAGQEAWNCTSVGNSPWAMRIHDKTVKVRNSILVGGIKDAYNDGPSPDGYYERIPDVDYSVLWLSSSDAIAYSPKHELWNLTYDQLRNRINPIRPTVAYKGLGDNMVYADPQLVDTLSGFPRPGPKSPARSAGLWMDFLTRDLTGRLRVLGAPPDLGALTSLASSSLMQAHTPDSYATKVSRRTPITITFAEPVVEASAQKQFALIVDPEKAIRGAFEWLTPSITMRFIPHNPLPAETLCRVRLARGVSRLDGTQSIRTEGFTFTTGNEPVIESSRPQGKAVPMDAAIRVTFDRSMHRDSVEASFNISPGTEGILSWTDNEMVFTPKTALTPETSYTVTIGHSARSVDGAELGRAFVWTFQTVPPPPPKVEAYAPKGEMVDLEAAITINFDQPMHKLSVEECLKFEPGVEGKCSWNGSQLIYKPTEPLNADTDYLVTLGSHARSDIGVELGQQCQWSFHTAPGPAAMVTASAPTGAAVPLDSRIRVAFNQPMHRVSVQNAFAIEPNVPGKLGWSGNEFVFIPSAPLAPETDYVVSVSRKARTCLGVPLEQPINIRFRTVSLLPPRASNWGPRGKTVALESRITVDFDQPMHRRSVENSFSITPQIAGRFGWNGNTLIYIPEQPLRKNTLYTVALAKSARSTADLKVKTAVSWSFRTAVGPTPKVIAKAPQGNAVNTLSRLSLTFDQSMHKGSVEKCFNIKPAVAGRFAWKANQLIFTPDEPLAAGTCYTLIVGQHARSSLGVETGKVFSTSFTTATAVPLALSSVATSTSHGAQIVVNLSAAAQVSVEIRNMAGRTVAALPTKRLSVGTTSLLWSGQGLTGTKVPAGQYLVCVRAVGEDGTQVQRLVPLNR